jgi:hypothetical protein
MADFRFACAPARLKAPEGSSSFCPSSFCKTIRGGRNDDQGPIALQGAYVVQERLDLQMEEFPIFSEQDWRLQPMYVDTNPFLFRGEVHGAMVRLSDSPQVANSLRPYPASY